jgi:hypothetical protein
MSEAATESDAAVAAMLTEGIDPEGTTQPEGAEEGQEPTSIDDLPDWAQEEIRKLRRENATKRVTQREQSRRTKTDTPQSTEASQQAITAAEERGRQAARMENGIRLAGAEVKAALAATLTEDQIADIVDDLNLSRFVDDDGEVDSEAVHALRDKYTALVGKRTAPKVSHGRQTQVRPVKSTADAFADALGEAFN